MNNIVDYGLREAYNSMKSMDKLSEIELMSWLAFKYTYYIFAIYLSASNSKVFRTVKFISV